MMEKWQKPKTTRLYIHPPMSENFYTLWREGKIIFGESLPAVGIDYFYIISKGVWFTHNKNSLDFKTAKYCISSDGTPIHKLLNKVGKLDFELETFATVEKRSTCYIKLTFSNNTDKVVSEDFGFILRTGKECELVFEAPDLYAPYNPNLNVWKKAKSTWQQCGSVYFDGDSKLLIDGELEFVFNEETGSANTVITLLPKQTKSIILRYAEGVINQDEYDFQKKLVAEFWNKELSKITRLPKRIIEDESLLIVVKNLTAQILQCFCRPKGTDFVFARQGGLQRQIWTYESMSVLEALSEIGDFDNYIDPVIKLYFDEFWTSTGEVVPMGIHWAMVTGTVLSSFSKHALKKGKDYYLKYRDKAFKSFEWIKNTRLSVEETEFVVHGLFPPMRSCDDPLEFQSWTLTDGFNIRGITDFYKTAKHYGDKDLSVIENEVASYKRVMAQEWQRISLSHANNDEIDFPLSPRLSNDELSKKFEFSACPAIISDIASISSEDMEKVLTFKIRRGLIEKGFYDKMADKNDTHSIKYNLDKNGKCVVWYVCHYELYWFEYFMKIKRYDKAKEIVMATLNYAMTDEYYMLERYNEQDPWFSPWSPNASANGRIILMLTAFYKKVW